MTAAAATDRLVVEQFQLANGLRVVVSPSHRAPVAAVALAYDVGTRSEPPGRSGFAHLFEHLTFQSSVTLPPQAHVSYIQGTGGSFNAVTHADYTEFHQILPVGGLDRALFLEADRMRGLSLTEEQLRTEVEVVKQEIRGNLHARPYAGFPYQRVAELSFDTFPNTHDGYGSFEDLESATVADARDFFDRYYLPGNAVLAICGDVPVEEAGRRVAQYFGDLPARPGPPAADWAEPELAASRHTSYRDPLAPLPAVAVGWRTPDPVTGLPALLAYVLLTELLAAGPESRLTAALVESGRALAAGAQLSPDGQWLTCRGPALLVLHLTLPPGGDPEAALAGAQAVLTDLAGAPPGEVELDRARAMVTAALLRGTEPLLARARWLAPLVQQRGDATTLLQLPELLAEVTPADVAAAAARLASAHRATVVVEPGAGR